MNQLHVIPEVTKLGIFDSLAVVISGISRSYGVLLEIPHLTASKAVLKTRRVWDDGVKND